MEERHPDTQQLAQRVLCQKLQSLHRAGVGQLKKPPPLSSSLVSDELAASSPPELALAPGRSETVSVTVDVSGESLQERIEALQILGKEIAQCTRCTELATTRTQTVLGVGNAQARLCFLGEAPGADEDRQGEPFVGRAGQLLNKIIQACTMTREQVYILNVLKCRPPGNRNPLPDEIANCREYFDQQLAILRPEFICCLGLVAAQGLLETTRSLRQLRGRFHDYQGIKVMATYHPAYLLRQPDMKRAAWEDMKMLMREMGLEIPAR